MKYSSAAELTRQQLFELLSHSIRRLTSEESQSVQSLQRYTQEKCYKTYTGDRNQYLEYLLKGLPKYQLLQTKVHQMTLEKQNILEAELQKDMLKFEGRRRVIYESPQNEMRIKQAQSLKQKIDLLKRQMQGFQIESKEKSISQAEVEYQNNLSKIDLKELQLQRERQIKQFIKSKQKEKQERQKKLQELKEQEKKHQKAKQQEIKKQQQKQLDIRKQEMIDKSHRIQLKFQQQRTIREKHQDKYSQMKKVSGEQLPLFKKLENEGSNIQKEQQEDLRKRLISRRKKLNLSPFDCEKIEQHAKRYVDFLAQQNRKRQQRIKLRQQEEQQRAKSYSNYKEWEIQLQPSLEQLKQPLIQKRQRVKRYELLVKEQFKPKVSAAKRKQLLNLMEQLDLGKKRLKKIKLENGSVLFEELPRTDANQIGIRYLQYSKLMSDKTRSNKRHAQSPNLSARPHHINYLQEIKQQNKNRTRQSYSQQIKKYDYQQRLKRVQQKSDVIDEEARRKQVLLKYAKSMSTEEVHNYRKQLDDRYLQVINMKLSLIKDIQ